MLPEMTIEMITTAAMEAAEVPEDFTEIEELSREEKAELLKMWKNREKK